MELYQIIFDKPKLRAKILTHMMYSANKYQGICEQIRCIYDNVHRIEDEELKHALTEQLIDTMIMAKKMQARLRYYKETYNDTTGSNGKNLKRIHATERRIHRRTRD